MVYRCRNDRDWTLEFVSEGCYNLTGYTSDELMNEDWKRFANLILPEDRGMVWDNVQKALKEKRPYELEYRIITANGSIKWVWEKGSNIYIPDKKDKYLEGFITDITDRKKAEAELHRSLEEKDVLLSEIHHRVKNNLAVITGLLQLQAYNTEDISVRDILQESQSRIHSIAMIHEKLYQSDTLSKIELKNYISDLVSTIQETYNKDNISININADKIFLNVNQAIPCALILNELIVNAFKHAFKNLEKGEIVIKLTKHDKKLKLSVGDNGVGIPENFDILGRKSLGITLIKTLVRQLNADFSFENINGANFIIQFDLV